MDAWALGVELAFLVQFRLEAGDFGGKLRAVEGGRRSGLGLGPGLLALDRGFLRLRAFGRHGGLGRLLLRRLGRCGRGRGLADFLVLERRLLGGLGRGLVFQGAAAQLVGLGEEVGLLRFLLALEGGEGDFQGLADLLRVANGETDAEDQRHVQYGGEEQGKAQPIRRADAGGQSGGGIHGCVHRQSACFS
ncbi:hypothetical protein D9M71_433630 [compost metagenome]